MQALAKIAMRGPWPAAAVAAASALLALLLPPLLIISGAVIALVTLRRGWRAGLLVVALTVAGGVVLALISIGSPLPVVVFSVVFFLPQLALAQLLRFTVSLSATLRYAALAGCALLPLFYVIIGNPKTWLMPRAERLIAQLTGSGVFDAKTAEQALTAIGELAPLLPGQFIASVLLLLLISLFMGRAWQASLFNPGGFRQEFHELRLGKPLAVVMLIVFTITLLVADQLPLLINIILVLGVVYLIQSAALAHGLVAKLGISRGWLVAFYILLLTTLAQFLMLLSVADAWIDFRTRVKPKI